MTIYSVELCLDASIARLKFAQPTLESESRRFKGGFDKKILVAIRNPVRK